MMATYQGLESRLDALHGFFDRFSLGRTDRHGVFDPLAKQPGVSAFDLLDLKSLPEPLIEISQIIDPPGSQPQGLADDLGGTHHAVTRTAIQGGKRRSHRTRGQRFPQASRLDMPPLVQGDVEDPLNAVLL